MQMLLQMLQLCSIRGIVARLTQRDFEECIERSDAPETDGSHGTVHDDNTSEGGPTCHTNMSRQPRAQHTTSMISTSIIVAKGVVKRYARR